MRAYDGHPVVEVLREMSSLKERTHLSHHRLVSYLSAGPHPNPLPVGEGILKPLRRIWLHPYLITQLYYSG
jgi:hypothetical protein